MRTPVNSDEWAEAKVVLQRKLEQAQNEGKTLESVSFKISRKRDNRKNDNNDNVLGHSFYYINGKLFAGDDKWIKESTGSTGKVKEAQDEEGNSYILRNKGNPQNIHMENSLRIMTKRSKTEPSTQAGIYFSYKRELEKLQYHFKNAISSGQQEIQVHSKLVEIFAKKGSVNLYNFLLNEKLDHNQRRIIAINSALAIYNYHHTLGEAHRDLKQENIVIDSEAFKNDPYNFPLEIIDLEESIPLSFDKPFLLRRYGFGTPGFLSGEGILGAAGEAVDIYALGFMVREILQPLINSNVLSFKTKDTISQMLVSDATLRAPIPDLAIALWNELPVEIQNDNSPSINAIREQLAHLPPPLTPEQYNSKRIIDTPEELAVATWNAYWDTFTEDRKQNFHVITQKYRLEADYDTIRINLDRLDAISGASYEQLLERCTPKMKRFVNGKLNIEDEMVDELCDKLKNLMVLLSRHIPDELHNNVFLHKNMYQIQQFQNDTQFTTSDLDELVVLIRGKLEFLPEEYLLDSRLRKSAYVLGQLWNAIPENIRVTKEFNNSFEIIFALWNVSKAELEMNNSDYRNINAFRIEGFLRNIAAKFSDYIEVKELNEQDPFFKHVSDITTKNQKMLDDEEKVLSPLELIGLFKEMVEDEKLYEPLSQGLLKFTHELTEDNSISKPEQVKAALKVILIEDPTPAYMEVMDYYATNEKAKHRSLSQ